MHASEHGVVVIDFSHRCCAFADGCIGDVSKLCTSVPGCGDGLIANGNANDRKTSDCANIARDAIALRNRVPCIRTGVQFAVTQVEQEVGGAKHIEFEQSAARSLEDFAQ